MVSQEPSVQSVKTANFGFRPIARLKDDCWP